MKKLFSKFDLKCLLAPFFVFLFFLPMLLLGKVPYPGDSLLGLYHPWRDESNGGFIPGKFPVKNPLITDPVLQTYPWRVLTIKNLKEGLAPLWNPYSFSGQPLLANAQSSPFQILNITYFFLPFKIAWQVQVIGPALLTALFMYFFIRKIKLSTEASIFGSFILPLSGFFVAWLTWGNIITTAMWLPLMLLAVNNLLEKISKTWFFILVFASFQTLVSGHSQTALYIFIASFFYFLYIFIKSRNKKNSLAIIMGLALSFLIASPQLLPILEFAKNSARSIDQGYYQGRQDWFLPPQHLIQLIAPDFFGNPARGNYWGVWNYAEFVAYIGTLPFLLALVAIYKKSKESIFFILLTFFSLLIVLANPLSMLPYLLNFPVIATMQPSRAVFLLDFSLCVLAAFGFEHIFKSKINFKVLAIALFTTAAISTLIFIALIFPQVFPHSTGLVPNKIAMRNLIFPLFISSLSLIVLFLRWKKLPKTALIILIFAITAVDLFRFAYRFTPFVKTREIYPKTKIEDFLSLQQKPFRIISTDRRIMPPNTSTINGIESVSGYDPLFLKDYSKLVSSWNSKKVEPPGSFNRIVTPENYDSKITDLLNVKYILSFDEINNPKYKKVSEAGLTKVYENQQAQNRAFFVKNIVRVSTDDEALVKILDDKNVLKESAFSKDISFSAATGGGTVNIATYNDQSLSLRTDSDEARPLVISNIDYPGWVAKIDGQKNPIFKVNFILQGLIVPQGTHTIVLEFKSESYYFGLKLAALGVIGLLLSELYLWKRKYQ